MDVLLSIEPLNESSTTCAGHILVHRRPGISTVTLRNIERGVPSVGIGTVFEAATILGIELFGADREGLRSMVERGRDRLALLPSRVREPNAEVCDDF
jgi:hypothetical protein